MVTERGREAYTGIVPTSPGANPLTLNSSGSYTGTLNQLAGVLKVQNNSGGTTGTITLTLNNNLITANSYVGMTLYRDANSASGVEYLLNGANVAAGSVQALVHKATTSPTASFNNLEGFSVHFQVIP